MTCGTVTTLNKNLWPVVLLLLYFCCVNLPAQAEQTIVFGSTPWDNTNSMLEKHQPLMDHMSERLGSKTNFIVTRDYADLEKQLMAGTIDIGFMPASSYVQARRSMPGLSILASHTDKHPVTGEYRDHYRGVIISLKSSGLNSLEALKNKRFGFTDINSSSGYRYPTQLMLKQGIDPQNHFSQIFMLQKHPKVTQALLNGAIDAGATWDVHLSRMIKKHGDVFHIIKRTNPIPLAAVVASPHFSRSKAHQVKSSLLNIAKDPKLLAQIRATGLNTMGWRATTDVQYDSVRKILAGNGKSSEVKQVILGIRPAKALYQVNKMWSPLLQYLSDRLKVPVVLQTTGNYDQLTKRIETGQFDIAVFPAFAYVKAKERIPNLSYVATLLKKYADGRVTDHYNGVLVSLKSARIRTLQDLRNKRFGFTSKSSTSGFLYPNALLLNHNITPAQHFSHIFMLNKHEKVIKSLLSKAIDGGATTDDELYRANNKYGDIFHVIATTEDIPFDAMTIGPHLPMDMVGQLTDAIEKLPQSPQVIEQLQNSRWKYAGFTIKSDAFYDKVRDVRDTFERNKSP